MMKFEILNNNKNYNNINIQKIKYLLQLLYKLKFILYFISFKILFIYYKYIFLNIIILYIFLLFNK